MAKRDIEGIVARLSAARDIPREQAVAELRAGLADRVNLVTAKAAKMAGELQLRELIPELLAALDRLFVKPVERDAQCWGKNAIAQALVDLDHRESAPFLMGARHVQMEPVWGGQEDTAQKLRGICLLALAACIDMPRAEILRILVDAMADPKHPVRIDAVRAMAQMEGDEALLLLRLKARMGDREPSVTGQVFDSLLALERTRALPLVKEYLDNLMPAVQEEASLALGASRMAEAVDILIETLPRAKEPDFRKTVLRALGASRQEKAMEFLRSLVEEDGMDSTAAKEALGLD